MADDQNKDTGKYIDILNIFANKENLDGSEHTDTSGMKTQFTAEEFNGIVRALRELYQATSDKEFWVNEFVDLTTGDTSVRNATIKKGNPFSLEFNYISKYRKGFGSYIISNSDIANFTISYKKSGSSAAAQTIYDSKNVGGENKPLTSNTSFSLDVSQYLLQGGKYEFTISGENVTEGYAGEATAFVLYYNITVTDMSLEFQNETWWLTPFVYGENGVTSFNVSFRVGGSGNRKVILTTSGTGVTRKEYTAVVDTGSTTVSFDVEMPANRNTIMNISAYMQNTDDISVTTDPIDRNCMIIKSATQTGQKLMAVNEFKYTVKGGQTHKLFSYAVYDSDSTDDYTNLVFTSKIEDSGEITTETKSARVALKTRHEYEIDLASVSIENPTYLLKIGVKDDKSKTLMQERTVTVDNSFSFSPVSGAVWYMNPSGRTNSESRREEIKNSVDNTYVTATWNNFAWSSGDGWVSSSEVDENSNSYTLSSLRVLSGSSVNINYQPLNMGALGMRTIEIDYKISAISDDTVPAIVITQNDKAGIKIYPNRICTGTTSLGSDLQREIATDDSIRIRAAITLSRNEGVRMTEQGPVNINYIRIYINGILAKIYNIGDNESMNNAGNIIIGSTGCDIDVYGIRVYAGPLTHSGIVKNYINRLDTSDQKKFVVDDNRVFKDEQENNWMGSGIVDFKNTVDQYNVFVFDGDVWPNYDNPNKSMGNLELYSVNNIGGLATPDGTGQCWKISNVEVKGQGTSSMTYYEWNLQFKTANNSEYWPLVRDDKGNWYDDKGELTGETHGRIDKNGEPVLGEDGKQIMDPVYSKVTYDDKKVPMFTGVPKANAIVMKKNWASSMQDHKMGSVNSYTEVWKMLGFSNAATTEKPETRISVYQEPMLGFHKKTTSSGEIIYEYKGLFTGGPHKGDKQCFGYDSKKWPNLISIEGASNDYVFAEFSVPWKKGDHHVSYDPVKKGFTYDTQSHWDFNFGAYDSDDSSHVNEIVQQLNDTFHDAYNIVYECNQNLYPFEGTEEDLFRAVSNNTITLNRDYWLTSTYELYHVFEKKGLVPVEKVDTGNGPINLLTQLGDIKYDYSFTKSSGSRFYNEGTTTVTDGIAAATTPEEKNEIFKKARIVRFRKEAGKYWDLEDAIFHHCWIEFFAGSDQRTKNTYPYSYQTKDADGNLTKDGLWKWRLDDADTIGPIDNSGVITKKYSVEVHDLDEKGSPLFNGQNNCFWNLIETLEDKYYSIMSNIFTSMVTLSNSSGSICNQMYKFYDKYFLSIKKYFPEVLYNENSERYEKAYKSNYPKASMALAQSLGNAYSPESAWYKKRIEYMTSKYSFGDYKNASVQNTFVHRISGNKLTNGEVNLTFTLGMDLYPTMDLDDAMVFDNKLCKAGEPFNVLFTSGGDADWRVHGAKYYTDLGDLHTVNFSDNSQLKFTPFSSIKELNLGWPDASQVVGRQTSIDIPGSLRKIYLENCTGLNTISGLDRCISLKEINALGTKVAYFNFANGAPIETIKYPETVENLQFLNCPFLKEENIEFNGQENISIVYINNTPGVPAIKIVSNIIEAQSKLELKPLKYLNIQGVNETFIGTESVKILELLNNITNLDNGFKGVNSLGQADDNTKPTITGKIGVEFSYEDTERSLEAFFPGLDITVSTYYIRFKDPNVETILMTYMKSLGILEGTEQITTENAKEVTTFTATGGAGIFRGVDITSFDELKYFTNYTQIYSKSDSTTGWAPWGDFQRCESLKSIALDNITVIGENAFEGSGLETVNAPALTSIAANAFKGCTSLYQVGNLGKITTLSNYAFSGCTALKKVVLPETLTNINQNAFDGCTELKEIVIPSKVAGIGEGAFNNSGVTTIYWNCTLPSAPNLPDGPAFGTNIQVIYMPKAIIDLIGIQTTWKPYINLLVPYDFEKNPVS